MHASRKQSKKKKKKMEETKEDASKKAADKSQDNIVCFFSDALYQEVIGPTELEKRFLQLINQFRSEKEKNPAPMHVDMDMPKGELKVAPKNNFQRKVKELHNQVLVKRHVLDGQSAVNGDLNDDVQENKCKGSHDADSGGKVVEVSKIEVSKNTWNESKSNQVRSIEVSKDIRDELKSNQVINMEMSKDHIDELKSNQVIDVEMNKDHIGELKSNQVIYVEMNKDHINELKSNQVINMEMSKDHIDELKSNQVINMKMSKDHIGELKSNQDNNMDESENINGDSETVEMETLSDEIFCLVMPSLSDEDVSESELNNSALQLSPENKKLRKQLPSSVHLKSQKQSREISEMCSDNSVITDPNAVEASSEQQDTTSPDLPEQDIPIFSVREEPAVPVNPARKNTVWAVEMEEQCLGENTKQSAESARVDMNSYSFQRSELTMAEHAKYLKLYNKYVKPYLHTQPPQIFTQQQIQELSALEALQKRVVNEQEEFQKYLQKLALRNPQAYEYLKFGARRYALTKASAYRLKRNYELKFSVNPKSFIPFVSRSQAAELTFCQTLLEVGVPPKIVLPSIQVGGKPVNIPHDFKKIDNHFPRTTNKTFPGYIHHEPVSLDANMKALVIKYGIQVAMSSSVFKCLFSMYFPGYSKGWNIPVKIEMCQFGGSSWKVIFLDKPLFEDDLLTRDHNTLFHKYALRTFISHPKIRSRGYLRSALYVDQGNVAPCCDKFDDDTFDIFSSAAVSLETFGTGVSKTLSAGVKGKELQKKKATIGCKDDEPKSKIAKLETEANEWAKNTAADKKRLLCSVECNLETDSPSSPAPMSPSPASPPSSPQKSHCVQEIPLSPVKSGTSLHSPIISSPKTAVMQRRSTRSLPLKTSFDQPSKKVLQSSGENLLTPLDSILGHASMSQSNSVFEFPREDPSQYIPPTEDCSSLMYNLFDACGKKVLIRCRSHGVLKDTKKPRQVYVQPKLEYQTAYGYEQTTLKETVKSWASCYTRQKTNLLRVRINSFTSEILMYEELEPHQILSGSFNFQPKEGFQFLDDLLIHLMSLDCGNYLLSHEVGADFCALRSQKAYESSDQRDSVKKINPDNTVPWIPIDPTLLTPIHIAHERIPATFLPKDFVQKKKKEPDNSKGNKHKKGKKRKGKGKKGDGKSKNTAGKNCKGNKK